MNRTVLPLAGRALVGGGGVHGLSRSIPVGQELVFFVNAVRNGSDRPIKIESIELEGSGIGTVAEVVRIEVGPWSGVPYLLTRTYPPSFRCKVQALAPFSGRVVPPGEHLRIAVWLRAASPGVVRVRGHRVVYEQSGLRFHQTDADGYRFRVAEDASPQLLDEPIRDCIRDRARVLPRGA